MQVDAHSSCWIGYSWRIASEEMKIVGELWEDCARFATALIYGCSGTSVPSWICLSSINRGVYFSVIFSVVFCWLVSSNHVSANPTFKLKDEETRKNCIYMCFQVQLPKQCFACNFFFFFCSLASFIYAACTCLHLRTFAVAGPLSLALAGSGLDALRRRRCGFQLAV